MSTRLPERDVWQEPLPTGLADFFCEFPSPHPAPFFLENQGAGRGQVTGTVEQTRRLAPGGQDVGGQPLETVALPGGRCTGNRGMECPAPSPSFFPIRHRAGLLAQIFRGYHTFLHICHI